MDWGVLVMSRVRICDGTSSRAQMNLIWFCVLRVSSVLLCDLWRFFVSVSVGIFVCSALKQEKSEASPPWLTDVPGTRVSGGQTRVFAAPK